MLYREIIAVCSEIHTKHINTLCGQNVELLNVKPGGTYSSHWALRVLMCVVLIGSVTRSSAFFRIFGGGSRGSQHRGLPKK
jgi:hypothetical protein